MFFPFVCWLKSQKTRDCLGNRGFLKIYLVKLKFLSLDANMAGAALPNGLEAIDQRVRHRFCECGFHS
jgi:hypothetical protein